MKNYHIGFGVSLLALILASCGSSPNTQAQESDALLGAPEGAVAITADQPAGLATTPRIYALNGSDGFVLQTAASRTRVGRADNFDILLVDSQRPISNQNIDFMKTALRDGKRLVLDAKVDGNAHKDIAAATAKLTGGASITDADAIVVDYDKEKGQIFLIPVVAPSSVARLQSVGSANAINTVENVLGF